MRTLLKFGACASLLFAAAPTAHAQGILGRITKKATDAIEKKAEDKVNAKIDAMTQKMVDNSFSAVFGDSTDAAGGGSAGGGKAAGGGMPFSLGSNAKTESSYTFSVVTTMEIESSKGKGKSVMKMHFNPNEAYTGTAIESADGKKPDGNAFIVLDAKNQAMVMLMASEKNKFSIAYDWKEAQKYAQSAPREQVNWDTVKVWRSYSKIGTKTIAGYTADGYKTESPDTNVEIWVSRDRKLAVSTMFAASSSMKQMKGRLPEDYPQGLMLEMTSTNTKSGEKVTMRVTNIDTNAHVTYAMSDYPKMDMGKK